MRKIIITVGLMFVSVLIIAAQQSGPPHQPAASAAPDTAAPRLISSCASSSPLASEERAELDQALELIKGTIVPSAVLAKLIANRSELPTSEEQLKVWRESLPPEFKTRLLTKKEAAANPSFSRALAVARRVSDAFGFKNRFLIFYQSDKPLLATWKEHFILVSTTAVELLSEAEFAGQIAHEMAHLFYLDELKRALETNDDKGIRIVELRCDLVAMMMLERLKLNPQAVATGLAVMINWLAARSQIEPDRAHPSLCARIRLSEEYAAKINSRSSVVQISGADFGSLTELEDVFYLKARKQ